MNESQLQQKAYYTNNLQEKYFQRFCLQATRCVVGLAKKKKMRGCVLVYVPSLPCPAPIED